MQDEEELSYAIRPLGNHLFPTHALCSRCNEIKPIKSFKTKSTNAQAIAWGYKKAIEITSDYCEVCRRPKKKLKDLTLKEIHNKIVTGDIKGGAYGQMIKEDRRAEGIRKKREGAINRWKKIRFDGWNELLMQSNAEHVRVRKQKQIKSANTHPELNAFVTAYATAIVNVRSLFIEEKKLSRRNPDKGVTWEHYLGKAVKDRLIKLWSEIPSEHKMLLTPPVILSNRLETTEKEKKHEGAT